MQYSEPFDTHVTVAIWVSIEHHVPDRIKPSFVIFDILSLTLRAKRQSARMSKITNDGQLNPVWHRMLYSSTHMKTVGVKGLIFSFA